MKKALLLSVLYLFFLAGCGPGSSAPGSSRSNSNSREEPSFEPLTARARNSDNKAINVAIFPGGGLNLEASVLMAELFQGEVGQLNKVFDLFWGLSGGTIPATFFDNGIDEVSKKLKKDVIDAFPNLNTLATGLDLNNLQSLVEDGDGKRRKNFIDALIKYIGDKNFTQSKSRVVIVASAEEQPVCFAHPTLVMPATCKKLTQESRVADAVVDSSNYQIPKQLILDYLQSQYGALAAFALGGVLPEQSPSFQIRKEKLIGQNSQVPIVDGFLASQYNDGNSPLPLAVEHLLSIKTENNAEHTAVVFDNGSATIPYYSNQAWRDSIGMNNEGFARVEKDGVAVNVYLIKISQTKNDFDAGIIDTSPGRWGQLETLVESEIKGPRKNIFDQAVQAVKKNM